MRRDQPGGNGDVMTRNRTLILSALVSSLCPLVGNGIWAGHGTEGGSILASAREGLPVGGYVGLTLELVGLLGLGVLLGWFVTYLYERTPIAAVTTAIAGSAMLAVKVGSAGPLMVVDTMSDDLDPVIAELLVSLNDQAFVISGFLFCAAFLAAGVGLLSTEFPRWLSWWALIAGGLGVVAGAGGIVRPDNYVPVPFLLLLLWMIAVAISGVMGRLAPSRRIGANALRHPVAATE